MATRRVLHVISSLSRLAGGVSSVVRALAVQQSKLGHDVSIACLKDKYLASDAPEFDGMIYVGRRWGPKGLAYCPGLARRLRAVRPAFDVVHAHGLWDYIIRVAASLADQGAAMVLSPHGMYNPQALQRANWKKKIASALYTNAALARVDAFHALTDNEAAQIRRAGHTKAIAVLANGVHMDQFQSEPTPEQIARDWPDLAERPVALFLGRLHPIKGLANLIDAWARIVAEHPQWRLVLAGPDVVGHQRELEARVQQRGLAESVLFVGGVFGPEKQTLLARADLFVLPSFTEGFSVAVLEALAFRNPVLITSACNFDQVVPAGVGLVAEPEVHSLADGLRRLMQLSPAQRQEMGDAGRRLIETEYSWRRIAEQMIECYDHISGRGPRPAFMYDADASSPHA